MVVWTGGSGAGNDTLNGGTGDDLWVSTAADLADGVMTSGVVIEDYYLGGNNQVEWLVDSAGGRYWLPSYD